MWTDRLQRQRFERKYIISEDQARLAREFIKCHLVPDPFTKYGQGIRSYRVCSLYIDSPDLITYWAWVCCEKTRFKLRIRYYDFRPDAPLFFEIKARNEDCILKSRAPVRAAATPTLLAGHPPTTEQLAVANPDYLHTLLRFTRLVHRLQAKPVVFVSYMREAWVSPQSNALRITFDRDIRCSRQSALVFSARPTAEARPFGSTVVMEVKFTDRFPHWVQELVEQLNLVACGAAKYCRSVECLFDGQIPSHPPTGIKQRLAEVPQT